METQTAYHDARTRQGRRPKVEIRDLSFAAGGNPILTGLNLAIHPGEFLCLLGPSGCGKTTLLRLLGGLLRPDGGSIRIGGLPPQQAWSQAAYVFQAARLCPWRTVEGNVSLALELRHPKLPPADRAARVHWALEQVGMAHAAHRYPRSLSGGEGQRVSLARALAADAQILLMDEPFASLDPGVRSRLQKTLLDLWSRLGATIVFVTHDIDEALVLADRIVLLTPRPARVLDVLPVDRPRPREPQGVRHLKEHISQRFLAAAAQIAGEEAAL